MGTIREPLFDLLADAAEPARAARPRAALSGALDAAPPEHAHSGGADPVMAPDDEMEACYCFDGRSGFLHVPAKDKTVVGAGKRTVIAWACPEAFNGGGMFQAGAAPAGEFALRTMDRTDAWCVELGGANAFEVVLAGSLEEWRHYALVYDGRQVRLYFEGELKAQKQVALDTGEGFRVGARGDKVFKGRIAHLRYYDHDLTLDEIRADREKMVDPGSVFKAVAPLGFSLHDENDQPALYVASGERRLARLSVANTSGRSLVVERDSAQDFHLQLRFRPGIFPPGARVELTSDGGAGWKNAGTRRDEDGTLRIELRYAGEQPFEWKDGESQRFSLSYDSADPTLGSRGAHVLLAYHGVRFEADTATFDGTAVEYVQIVSALGTSQPPFLAAWIGSLGIVNDGKTSNRLTLRLFNSAATPLKFNQGGDQSRKSFIQLSFDDPAFDGALGKKDELAAVSVDAVKKVRGGTETPGHWTKVAPTGIHRGPVFQFELTGELPANDSSEFVDLEMRGLLSSKPSGPAFVYLGYFNVHGYRDGRIALGIMKSPAQTVENAFMVSGAASLLSERTKVAIPGIAGSDVEIRGTGKSTAVLVENGSPDGEASADVLLHAGATSYRLSARKKDGSLAVCDKSGAERLRIDASGTVRAQRFRGAGLVPLGAVVDFIKGGIHCKGFSPFADQDRLGPDSMPSGFVECNGETVLDPESPLRGTVLPKIKQRYLNSAWEPTSNWGESYIVIKIIRIK